MGQSLEPHRSPEAETMLTPLDHMIDIDGTAAALNWANTIEQLERPIVALAAEYPEGGEGASHVHRRAQLLYSCAGVMTVTTANGNWIVPHHHALWIPGGLEHRTRYCGPVRLRTLYLDPLPQHERIATCRLFKVSQLLRCLIDEAMALPTEYGLVGRDRAVMDLVLHEIGRMPDAPLTAPLPKDQRLARICREILLDPGSDHDIEHWTRVGGLSRRTLARLFLRETGMSFTDWRQRVRLLEALVRITSGQPITTVALDMGYESASSFTAMFRRNLGSPPSIYILKSSEQR